MAGRRLAAVQLDETNAATAREIAAGFGVKEPTLWRWRAVYRREGVAGLVPRQKGPKGPTKLTEDTLTEITRLRQEGLSLRVIGERVGVSHDSVLRALGSTPKPVTKDALADHGGDLVALARPAERSAEREAARRGMLEEPTPVMPFWDAREDRTPNGTPTAGAPVTTPIAGYGVMAARRRTKPG
ncbi:MAG: helix-turn-helix domain-containing protein [Acidimicrobiales bacterium]